MKLFVEKKKKIANIVLNTWQLCLLEKQEEAMDKNLAPDGYYVPRILFVGKYGLKIILFKDSKYNNLSPIV